MLVITLWALLFLTFFTITLSAVIMQRLNISERFDARNKGYFAAKAGIETAKAILNEDESLDYDGTVDIWANNTDLFKDAKLRENSFNVSYTIKAEDNLSEPVVIYGLIDEERKLNINKADRQALARFFSIFDIKEAEELASSIVDWRDEDSETTQSGAENAYYDNLEYPYCVRNSFFKSIYELLLVKGMKKEYFDIIKEYITVFGDGTININTTSQQALKAIGLSQALIEKIIEYRNGLDGIAFSLDDRVFKNTSDIKPKLNSFKKLSSEEDKQIESVISNNLIGIKAQYFEVRSEGKTNYKKVAVKIDCVISRNGEIKFWYE